MRAVIRHYMELQLIRDEQRDIDSKFGCVPPYSDDDAEFDEKLDKVAQMCGYDSWQHVIWAIFAEKDEAAQYGRSIAINRHIMKTAPERNKKYRYRTEYFEGQGNDLRYFIYHANRYNCNDIRLFKDGRMIMYR